MLPFDFENPRKTIHLKCLQRTNLKKSIKYFKRNLIRIFMAQTQEIAKYSNLVYRCNLNTCYSCKTAHFILFYIK